MLRSEFAQEYLYRTYFFFNDTATTEIYTLSLHDALPICQDDRVPRRHGRLSADERGVREALRQPQAGALDGAGRRSASRDPKSTRLNSSHVRISYAVFCLEIKLCRDRRDYHERHHHHLRS